MSFRIGVDLGGTKTEIIALSARGETLLRRRRPTPAGDYRGTVDTIAALVAQAERELGARGTVGIGTPGAVSLKTGLLKNANSTVLNGQRLHADLEQALGREVRIENDANCFAISEAVDGAGRGAEVVFGIILGTGVGGGLVVRGQVVAGAARIAGEWGHNPLPPVPQRAAESDEDRTLAFLEVPGPACYCGRFGCIETWLSGPGLAADYARIRAAANAPGVLARRAGGDGNDADTAVTGALGVIERSRAGDPHALTARQRYADRLARALAGVVNIVDPQVIVLGGGLSGIAGLADDVSARLPRYVFSDEVRTEVRVNLHGDSSGVRGAAWLWGT